MKNPSTTGFEDVVTLPPGYSMSARMVSPAGLPVEPEPFRPNGVDIGEELLRFGPIPPPPMIAPIGVDPSTGRARVSFWSDALMQYRQRQDVRAIQRGVFGLLLGAALGAAATHLYRRVAR